MSQIGTPLLALFKPRLAVLSFLLEALHSSILLTLAVCESSAACPIRCLYNQPKRRNLYSDRSIASLVIWLRSPNFGCDYLIQPACNVPHLILYGSAFWPL